MLMYYMTLRKTIKKKYICCSQNTACESFFFQKNVTIRKQYENDKKIEIRYSTLFVVIAIPMHDELIQMFQEGLLRQTLDVALLVVFLL